MTKEKVYEVRNISKTFKDGNNKILALKPTTFDVYTGELIAIIGPSGSGKSTLLTILGGLQKSSEGTLKINGKDFYAVNENKRADMRFSDIGFVLQSSNLVPFLTIKQQLKLKANYKHKRLNTQLADKIFKTLDIKSIENKYPSDISGGQRQRAAIACALYNEPKIILADEPTASLDTKKAFEVVELLKYITKNENKCVIMVTHDTRLLKYCDRIFKIEDGVLTEESLEEFKQNI